MLPSTALWPPTTITTTTKKNKNTTSNHNNHNRNVVIGKTLPPPLYTQTTTTTTQQQYNLHIYCCRIKSRAFKPCRWVLSNSLQHKQKDRTLMLKLFLFQGNRNQTQHECDTLTFFCGWGEKRILMIIRAVCVCECVCDQNEKEQLCAVRLSPRGFWIKMAAGHHSGLSPIAYGLFLRCL